MKKIILFIAALVSTLNLFSQTLFSNSFGNLILQTYTTSSSSVDYTTTPSIFTIIKDGYKNNIGSATNPNKPFNVPAFKTEGWEVVYNPVENDTFLVCTSWLDTAASVDRWIITPSITNITANSVLTWLAKSPDVNNKESYLVYGTNKTGTLTPQDFNIGDQLYTNNTENDTWTRHSVNLAAFAGQTLRFAFRDNSNNKYQLWIDDIEILTLSNNLDAALVSIQTPKYVLTNSSQTISTTISNLGAATINAVALNYQIGNSTVQTETISFSSSVGYKQSSPATFALAYNISSAGNYKLKTWISGVNGSPDQDHSNDTSFTYITIQGSAPKKSVLVEHFVSAFDGECSGAQERILARQNDSVIVVNVHDLDSLKEANSTGIISAYKKNTATAMFDRTLYSKPGTIASTHPYYDSLIYKQLRKISPAGISIVNKTYNPTTKELSFTIKADFIGDVKGDLRLNAYLTENFVHGPWNDTLINGYNQLNDFYNVPWSAYYLKGYYASLYGTYVLNGVQFQHQNTLVYSFDGSFGNPGLIPTTGGTQNQSYQKTYSLTVPTATNNINKYTSDNLYIVGFLAEYDADSTKRNVLNVVKEKITPNGETLGIKENIEKLNVWVYPNPSNGTLYLNSPTPVNTYKVKVYDLMGKCVFIEDLFQVGNTAILNVSQLNNGIYFLSISSESGNFIEKIVIQKN
ncbi:MAG: T9SS type A sorting domain-containing protein [Bacteroidetes bacterium]|nr:T9SS type A sorting domain-containing protein [Bacteroidota bacterium]